MLAEIELLMRKKVSALEDVYFKEVSILERMSEAEYGSRNIPLSTILIILLISKLLGSRISESLASSLTFFLGSPIKAGKIIKKIII